MSSCKHWNIKPGPRIPLVYGSSPTDICCDCGAWRGSSKWLKQWRDASTLAEMLLEDEEY